jgi:hypothetical protein
MLAGFIVKMTKQWAVSMYGSPDDLCETFKGARESALKNAERY